MINSIKSVLLDNSFVTRLLKGDDPLHQNVVNYYEHFLNNGVVMYLSTIVVSEYSVADDPINLLSLKTFRLLEFDYQDAKLSGELYKALKDNNEARNSIERKVIINDLKLFAQIQARGIESFIQKMLRRFLKCLPL
ncbi:hypothetical protein [Sphingobacterium daejeonense]|uniref:hypothetical protein n=1 Tax=Sphingobacterium daejeonense TaxID=371142 RepID=UPI0010C2CBBC|nr:hypothetical protein [Sphingobacterium daejeonense]VTQ00309.1 Uncharacterised protein [Sphingobacterium daejeonense]